MKPAPTSVVYCLKAIRFPVWDETPKLRYSLSARLVNRMSGFKKLLIRILASASARLNYVSIGQKTR